MENKEIVHTGEQLEHNNNKRPEIKMGQLPPLFFTPLGGQGEVGKNCYFVEMGNEIWVFDAGIKFASDSMVVEGIIPSFEYLQKNQHKLQGLIITHGHEDHIGAVAHMLYQVKFPKLYAGRLAAALVDSKLRERGVSKPKVEIINNRTTIYSRNFEINVFNVIHSTPDSFGFEIKTKHGTIVSSGDFKFDFSPIGTRADLFKMAKLGKENVTLLLSDSTNAETDKWSPSEMTVSKNINSIVSKAEGRVIITTFASNVYRVREILNIALKHNRKIAVFGWSMDKVVDIARRIKYINIPETQFIDEKQIKNYKDEDILVICTGGQGEVRAALYKMAEGKNPSLKLKRGDTMVFATNAIPGNYKAVEELTNKIIKLGANVYDNTSYPGIHTSGHAGKTEEMLMLSLIRPRYFAPIHGENKMLLAHIKSAIETGVNKDNCFILPNGGRLKIVDGKVEQVGPVPAEDIFVDDSNLTGQSNKVISDRNKMSKNGIVAVSIMINSKENKIIDRPAFTSKGTLNEKSNKEFIHKLENEVMKEVNNYYKTTDKISFSGIKDSVRTIVEKIIFDEKKLSPIVVPIVLNTEQMVLSREFNKHNQNTQSKGK